MIKDAIANVARPPPPDFRFRGRSAQMRRSDTEFCPLKGRLMVVDVNVLYHPQIWMAGRGVR